MPLKYVLSVMGLVDHPKTPKLWAIAHDIFKNDKSFCHSSLECIDFHIPCKSPRDPKKMGNSSLEMHPPRNLKEMQCLAGCMAALGRFIVRSGEKALPFFKLMKRTGKF
jgi:hypothetical protein